MLSFMAPQDLLLQNTVAAAAAHHHQHAMPFPQTPFHAQAAPFMF
jgi:hypothetical protein